VREFSGNLLGVASFDLKSLEHVNQFAILQQCD
jgi:hypothetical protein